MPSLKDIRQRIASVNNTKKITSAMKLVSASKLRKAQEAILKMRPYSNKLRAIVNHAISSLSEMEENRYSDKRKKEKVLLILIASNRGLCGSFNSNIVKAARQRIRRDFAKQAEQKNLFMISIGKSVSKVFAKDPSLIMLKQEDELLNDLSFNNVVKLADLIIDGFIQKKYDHIEIIYNRFKNAASQQIINEQFLPIKPDLNVSRVEMKVSEEKNEGTSKTNATGQSKEYQMKADTLKATKGFLKIDALKDEKEIEKYLSTVDFLFEPGKLAFIEKIIPKTLRIQLYKILLDSSASEHGARMTAMHQATENAGELISQLQLSYNKARQAAITNEILEIVSGAEALKGS